MATDTDTMSDITYVLMIDENYLDGLLRANGGYTAGDGGGEDGTASVTPPPPPPPPPPLVQKSYGDVCTLFGGGWCRLWSVIMGVRR